MLRTLYGNLTRSEKIQLSLTLVWLLLFYPAVMYWRESVPFLVFVSVYANFVGHLSAFEAARASRIAKEQVKQRST